eukprot:tig00020904_g15293.t1
MSGCGSRAAAKRARIDEPAAPPATAAEAIHMQAAVAFMINALPDALLGCVFKALGVQGSWPLRGVCRRWRRVVEETEWPSFDLRFKGPNKTAAEAVLSFVEKRTRELQLSAGASVSLRPEFEFEFATSDPLKAAGFKRSLQCLVTATLEILAAVARRQSGPLQPRAATVELISSEDNRVPRSLLEAEHEDFRGGRYRLDFLSSFLFGVLRALQPADEPASASTLESLSIGLHPKVPHACSTDALPFPPAAELRAALAPFCQLQSLTLCFGELDQGIFPEEAAAVAAACPLLRAVALHPRGAAQVLAALAPLARLEELSLAAASADALFDASRGLEALAEGPAGRSIRRIAFFLRKGHYREGEFPRRSPGATPCVVPLSGAGVLAFSRMPNLESIKDIELFCRSFDPATFLALGRVARLREAGLRVALEQGGAPLLRLLPEVLSSLPRLSRLGLDIVCRTAEAPSEGDVVALLGSPGARRALADLGLFFPRALSEAEAEAVVALPALRRLRVRNPDHSDPAFSLRPYEVLAGGLRPGVEVDFGCAGDVRGLLERRRHLEGHQ